MPTSVLFFRCECHAAAEMTGGALAGVLACPLYGDHAKYLDPLFPWGDKHHAKNTSMHGGVSALQLLKDSDCLTSCQTGRSFLPFAVVETWQPLFALEGCRRLAASTLCAHSDWQA